MYVFLHTFVITFCSVFL